MYAIVQLCKINNLNFDMSSTSFGSDLLLTDQVNYAIPDISTT